MLLTFALTALIINSSFLFLFRSWLGPIGTFYSTIFTFLFAFIMLSLALISNLMFGWVFYLDLGCWFSLTGSIESNISFCFDSLSLLTSSLVVFLASFVFYFGVEYMYREAFINRLLYLLGLFTVSVLFLFVVYDFFLILIAWELIGFFSFLLVNFYSVRVYTMKAALKTFVFSRISDLFIFAAFILIVLEYNSTDLSVIFAVTPFFILHYLFIAPWFVMNFLTTLTLLIVLSSVIKGAQFFFHVWLPDAMEAPTPASALIHSSTLVIMGVYLILRFSLMFEFTPTVNTLLSLWGSLTLGFAALTACFQNDVKKLVAYSTISQIGYLFCGCGFCAYEEVLFYLFIHAANKAFLFMLVGYIVHFFAGNTDMRIMGGVYFASFDILMIVFWISLNLMGLPYTAGFYAKEFLLFQVFRDSYLNIIVISSWFLSFFFTPIYMTMLVLTVFFGPKRGTLASYFELRLARKGLLLRAHKYYNTGGLLSITAASLLTVLFLLVTFGGEAAVLVIFNVINPSLTVSACSFLYTQSTTFFFISSWSLSTLTLFSVIPPLSALIGITFLVVINKTSTVSLFFEYRVLLELLSIILLLCSLL